MDYFPEPGVPGFFRYETKRHPYVEVHHEGEVFHAQAHGWKGDMVMIGKPVDQCGRVSNCGSQIMWVPASHCQRIRREDSTWITTEDDHDWHEEQDKTIEFRPSLIRD